MPQQQNLALPIAIVIAGALIGGALFFVGRSGTPTPDTNKAATAPAPKDIPAVTAADHIQGSMDAKIVIVEYTDLECPFCKQFDGTMKKIMDEYGKDGRVAWVIRNFPLQQLHPNAPKLALGAECAAALGGNTTYFKFLDSIILQAPINTFFDMTKLTATAEGVGLKGKDFDACVASGTYQEKITKEFNDAVAAGGQGTPFSVAIAKNGKKYPIPGSQPIEQVKALIDSILAGK
ncbi:MAG: thioredoxin domain-containing protein [Patescibacteria group bacterium]